MEPEERIAQLEELRKFISSREYYVKLADKIKQLKQNPLFKEVILDGFFKNDLVELAYNTLRPDKQNNHNLVNAWLLGSVGLRSWFEHIEKEALIAEKDIKTANIDMYNIDNED